MNKEAGQRRPAHFKHDQAGPVMSHSSSSHLGSVALDFDEGAYLLAFPDVNEALRSGEYATVKDHFEAHGLREGRLFRDSYMQALGLVPAPTAAHLPIPIVIDSIFLCPDGTALVIGWMDDRESALASLSLLTSEGWAWHTTSFTRVQRSDVEAALDSDESHSFGFFSTLQLAGDQKSDTPWTVRGRLANGSFGDIEVLVERITETSKKSLLLKYISRQGICIPPESESPSRAVQVTVDSIIYAPGGRVLVVGWLDDRESPLESISLFIAGEPERNTASYGRVQRPDVEASLLTSRGHSFGFWSVFDLQNSIRTQATWMVRARRVDGLFGQMEASPKFVSETRLHAIILAYFAAARELVGLDIKALLVPHADAGGSSLMTGTVDTIEEANDLVSLECSGLFDLAYYESTYPDIANTDVDTLDHYFRYGYREGRRPNAYFDTSWYLKQNQNLESEGQQPLLNFLKYGDSHGQNPSPFFDVQWYRIRYEIPPSENTLSHYLRRRFSVPLSPNPDFDADYYARKNPDVFAAKVDLFEHFLNYGYKELRDPSAEFNVKFYVQRYLKGEYSENPLLHYLAHRHEPGVYAKLSEDAVSVSREAKRFCRPGPYFEELQALPTPFTPKAMLLAYYLPQFHAFPENDEWWGEGFTEWTNLVRGSPRFVGHYQPRVPRDLGFYTLDSVDAMRRQIAMAGASGVSGFIFYFYWFNGKRVMHKPLNQFLADPSLHMKFALMWANENWTRRWDGKDSEVLMSQDYRDGDDEALAAEFNVHFKDPRYIRLQNRPLLMIYRADSIPDVKHAIAKWRTLFRTEFNEDPIFVMAQAFDAEDPIAFGFDGAIEFPPHKLTKSMVPANKNFTYLDEDFTGNIHQYDDVVAISLQEVFPNYPLIKTAIPSWDNDARRQGSGTAITGSTPQKYEAWLSSLVEIAQAHRFFSETIVCVNAWNEWCEGAYLEPDLHFGGAYLNATARAIAGRTRSPAVPRLILVGHDAFPSGAQHLLLNLGRTLHAAFGFEFEFLLMESGKLAGEYAALAAIQIITTDKQLTEKLHALTQAGFSGAIVNTTAAARAVGFLAAAGLPPVLLVHELPRILREKHLLDTARDGITNAARVVFSAPFVRDSMLQELAIAADPRMTILPQGSYNDTRYSQAAAAQIRQELGLAPGDHLVLGAGYADLRKGFDLFLHLWRILQAAPRPDSGRIFLAWAGAVDPGLADWLGEEIAAAEATLTFKMAGYRDDMAALFSAASVFALTSREDPLPTVVMEALSVGAPVAAFDRTGGIPALLRGIDEGVIVPYADAPAMAAAIVTIISKGTSSEDRKRRHSKIAAQFNFTEYVHNLVKLAVPDLAVISVAVPNFNYARFMPDRLGAIFQQTYPVREILVLDDASSDDSLRVIPRAASAAGRIIRIIANESNSGSVFLQWRRAAEAAQGEFLWIAEADDLSDPAFLAAMAATLQSEPNMKLAFADSRSIGDDGTPKYDSYKDYYASAEPGALRQSAVFNGQDFVRRFMAVKNLILNVSAVVWRRDALLQALDLCGLDLASFRLGGDWLLYLTVLSAPGALIGYEAKTLNIHRRHEASVTGALDADRHVAEIARCQAYAAEIFSLPPSVLQAQQSYLAEVAEQLSVVR